MPKDRLFVLSPDWQDKKEIIEKSIHSFEEEGSVIHAQRNTVKNFQVQGDFINIKRFRTPHFLNAIVYRTIRKSKAKRSFENASYLKEHGIGTPEPIAFIENYNNGLLGQSFYISRHQDHDFTFREIIHDEEMEDRVEILKKFTRFMYGMHEAGIYFEDHSPGNTLIKKVGDTHQFYLVDLNRMKFFDLTKEDRIKNFYRLTPYRSMHEIMGREYARIMGWDPEETVEQIMNHVNQFQKSFYRKRRWKNRFKILVGKEPKT